MCDSAFIIINFLIKWDEMSHYNRVESYKILKLPIISMFYSNFNAIKHCEINYVNRNVLFCINLSLILYFFKYGRDDQVRSVPGKKSILDEMTWYKMVWAREVP